MIRPTLDEARRLAEGATMVPVAMELYADVKTPIEVLRAIRAKGRECCLLESASGGENWGRYTFMGFAPEMTVSGKNGAVTVTRGGRAQVLEGDTHETMRRLVSERKSPGLAYLPPFTGGFVGYFSYEYISRMEPSVKFTGADDVGFDDFRLMLIDRVIAFDNLRQKIILIVNVGADNLEANYIDGVAKLKDMERIILSPPPEQEPEPGLGPAEFTASMSKEAYCAAVEKVKGHIREGDVFQCVPSIRFSAPYGDDLLGMYRSLRTIEPSAYMFYIRFADLQLAGASPETLVSLRDGVAATYPLAGTCRRSGDAAETDALIDGLLRDEKELAEHDMLVDLGRNDLGKVCKFGTVKVAEYRHIKRLSKVCHIASKVTGEPREGVAAADVLAAALPAGTLSGAPKIRACGIIDGIEGQRRGAYGGAVGYFDFTGNMDFCIGIRMAILKDGYIYAQAGAGVVADSVPEKEYDECLRKTAAIMEAIKEGRGRA